MVTLTGTIRYFPPQDRDDAAFSFAQGRDDSAVARARLLCSAQKPSFTELLRFETAAHTTRATFDHLGTEQAWKADRIECWISGGLTLIREGKYREAIAHFGDDEIAERFALHINIRAGNPVQLTETSYEAFSDAVDEIAYLSMFDRSRGQINFPAVSLPNSELQNPLVNELLREMATVRAEEWIHALQNLAGRLSSVREQNVDNEIDAAVLLMDHGVPLSPAFLTRYRREAYACSHPGLKRESTPPHT